MQNHINRLAEPSDETDKIYSVYRKGDHTYILAFDDKSIYAALYQIGRWASDGLLNFDWKDASVWAREIRDMNEARP